MIYLIFSCFSMTLLSVDNPGSRPLIMSIQIVFVCYLACKRNVTLALSSAEACCAALSVKVAVGLGRGKNGSAPTIIQKFLIGSLCRRRESHWWTISIIAVWVVYYDQAKMLWEQEIRLISLRTLMQAFWKYCFWSRMYPNHDLETCS